MHLRPRSRIARLLLLTLVATSATFTTSTSTLLTAAGPQTWWVAATGEAVNNPGSNPGAGTGCATPHFVGTTHEPIQAALTLAGTGDTIHICAGTYQISQTLMVSTTGVLAGAGARHTILDGGDTTQIMSIAATVGHTTGISLTGLQFRHGRITGDDQRGGAVLAHPDTTVTISDSVFRDNRSGDDHGGAVAMTGIDGAPNRGSLQIFNSTFANNIAGVDGGAISAVGLHVASHIVNSTFVGNRAGREGGAVNATFGSLEVRHSTFIDNEADDRGSALYHVRATHSLFASSSTTEMCSQTPAGGIGANVATHASCLAGGTSPESRASLGLQFLAPWGGLTPTLALDVTSSAVGTITSNCAATDQRGVPRTAPCAAGAFEPVANPAQITPREVTLALIAGRSIANYPAPVVSGFDAPVFRLATEVNAPLPTGVTFSSATGLLSGTPTTTTTARHLIVTATSSTGTETSMRITVDNCTLQRQNDEFLITQRSDLEIFALGSCGWDHRFRQTTDIEWNAPWPEVGPADRPFTGTYHGGGYALTGLQITGGNYTAFISHAENATISALRFSAEVTGSYGSAGLIARAVGTTVADVHGTGTITGTGGSGCIGGLLGEFYDDGRVLRSTFTGTIDDPNGAWVGGLAGCVGPAEVTASHFRGTVTGFDEVGGLIGWMIETEITDCSAIGTVNSLGSLGGLVGYQESDGPDADVVAVSNSFASVTLSAAPTVGGLIGSGESTALAASFWEDGLPGTEQLTAIGHLHDNGTPPSLVGTSATDMRRYVHFHTAGWSIATSWQTAHATPTSWGICDGTGLPYGVSAQSTDPCVLPTATPNPPANPGPSAVGDSPPLTPPATGATDLPVGSSFTAPSLAAGEVRVVIDGDLAADSTARGDAGQVNPDGVSVEWIDSTTVRVRIASTEVSLRFTDPPHGATGRGVIRVGGLIDLTAAGLHALSPLDVVVHSTPQLLGQFLSTTAGSLDERVALPGDLHIGAHRLELDLIDLQGRQVEIWVGLDVVGDAAALPASGGDTRWPTMAAIWLMLAGVGLLLARPPRRRMHPTT